MRRVAQQRRFSLDLKRQLRRGRNIEELVAVVELLVETGTLPDNYRPHRLTGEWKGLLGVPYRTGLAVDLRDYAG